MEKLKLIIGWIMFGGVLLSLVFVMLGGGLYLYHHGNDLVYYHTYHNEPRDLKSITHIFMHALSFSPLNLIQFGLLLLVIIQLLRVSLTAWVFAMVHDTLFTWISLFILSILIYSLIKT